MDAAGLRDNLRAVRSILAPSTRLMAVVKANAYGHGPAAAKVLAEAGADMLAVTTLAEALELREAGIRTPTLVFSPLLPSQLPDAIRAGLTLTLASLQEAQQLVDCAGRLASSTDISPIPVHLKVDTGMGRLGVLPSDAPDLARQIWRLPHLKLEGIYTHFATAMRRNLSAAREQFRRFEGVLAALSQTGDRPPIAHCANSAAVLQLPETHLDMVRVGTLLYGQAPAGFLAGRLPLKNTWRMFSRVTAVKEIPAGWTVGYGAEFHARRPTRVAIVPVGYADGLGVEVAARSHRSLPEKAREAMRALRGPVSPRVRIAGQSIPIIGRIGMQMVALDVTGLDAVQPGAAAEIPCRRVTSNPRLPRVLVE